MVLIQNFIFLYLFNLGTFGLENVFGDVPDRKLVYFDHKNTYLKKLQNLHFSKGVHGFDEKFEISLSFLLREIWPRKSVW